MTLVNSARERARSRRGGAKHTQAKPASKKAPALKLYTGPTLNLYKVSHNDGEQFAIVRAVSKGQATSKCYHIFKTGIKAELIIPNTTEVKA